MEGSGEMLPRRGRSLESCAACKQFEGLLFRVESVFRRNPGMRLHEWDVNCIRGCTGRSVTTEPGEVCLCVGVADIADGLG